jgi:predicted DNA-binding transcriptional regulator AlpA
MLKMKIRQPERLIRIGEIKRLTGLSTELYRKVATRDFPRPV